MIDAWDENDICALSKSLPAVVIIILKYLHSIGRSETTINFDIMIKCFLHIAKP